MLFGYVQIVLWINLFVDWLVPRLFYALSKELQTNYANGSIE